MVAGCWQQCRAYVAGVVAGLGTGAWWRQHWDAAMLVVSGALVAGMLGGAWLFPARLVMPVVVSGTTAAGPLAPYCPLPTEVLSAAGSPVVAMATVAALGGAPIIEPNTGLVATTTAVTPAPKRHAAKKQPMVGTLNLNTASSTALQRLPGIGPALAGRIVAYRKTHGPFARVAHITRVKGIGAKTLQALQPHLSL